MGVGSVAVSKSTNIALHSVVEQKSSYQNLLAFFALDFVSAKRFERAESILKKIETHNPGPQNAIYNLQYYVKVDKDWKVIFRNNECHLNFIHVALLNLYNWISSFMIII